MRIPDIIREATFIDQNEVTVDGYVIKFDYDDVTITKDGEIVYREEGDWSEPTTDDLKQMTRRITQLKRQAAARGNPNHWISVAAEKERINEENKLIHKIHLYAWEVVNNQFKSAQRIAFRGKPKHIQSIDEVVEEIKKDPSIMNQRVPRDWHTDNGPEISKGKW